MQTQMLINGQLIAGQGPAWTVLNPALGTALAQINEATEAQVDSAVRAADQASTAGRKPALKNVRRPCWRWPTPSKPMAMNWPGWNRRTAASP